MEQLLIIFNSLLFLLTGYLLGISRHDPETPKKVVAAVKKLPMQAAVKSGVIEYVTQADIDYHASGQDKVDEERERIFKEQFKP